MESEEVREVGPLFKAKVSCFIDCVINLFGHQVEIGVIGQINSIEASVSTR